jgi:predicted AAA+ superfamily ATPase
VSPFFRDYIELGGFPAVHIADLDRETARRVVQDIYDSVLLRNTIQRYNMRNIDLLERLIRFLHCLAPRRYPAPGAPA